MATSRPDETCTTGRITVYFDGVCPPCRIEIAHYRRQSGADALKFVDVSYDQAVAGAELTRENALHRFHNKKT